MLYKKIKFRSRRITKRNNISNLTYINMLNLEQKYNLWPYFPSKTRIKSFERTVIIKNVLAYLHMNLHDLHNSFITRSSKLFEYFTKK